MRLSAFTIDNAASMLSIDNMGEELKANRPHYHLWIKAKSGRMFYRLAYPYESRQAARQWGKRNKPDSECMALKCDRLRCAPKFE